MKVMCRLRGHELGWVIYLRWKKRVLGNGYLLHAYYVWMYAKLCVHGPCVRKNIDIGDIVTIILEYSKERDTDRYI